MKSLDVVLVTVISLAAFFDVTVRRIPNWLILFSLGAGLILNLYAGGEHFVDSLIGIFLGMGIFLFPFSLGWIGAGDVKYVAVVGAMLGVRLLPRVIFYSSIVAGILAVVSVLVGRFRLGFYKVAWNECKVAVLSWGRILPEPVHTRVLNGAYSLPWGVAISAGTILSYFIDPVGYWAGF